MKFWKKIPKIEFLDAFWARFVIKGDSKTPILDEFKKRKINLTELIVLMDEYEELFLWMFDCVNLQKRRTRFFSEWNKDQAFYEAQSTPKDVFDMIRKEIKYQEDEVSMKAEQKALMRKYTMKK